MNSAWGLLTKQYITCPKSVSWTLLSHASEITLIGMLQELLGWPRRTEYCII